MAVFNDIGLTWEGIDYNLSGDGPIMKALADVEEHLTLAELIQGQQSGKMPLAKLSAAYACMLRHAGCYAVTSAEVYAGMWKDGKTAQTIQEAVSSLILMMMPPAEMQKGEAAEGKPKAAKKSSSKRGSSGS